MDKIQLLRLDLPTSIIVPKLLSYRMPQVYTAAFHLLCIQKQKRTPLPSVRKQTILSRIPRMCDVTDNSTWFGLGTGFIHYGDLQLLQVTITENI
jgi:hypothetical protein